MTIRIGIITVRDSGYHPNRRLLEASHASGHQGLLLHPYRLWPEITEGKLTLSEKESSPHPHVVVPRQGAQIGDTSLALIRQLQLMGLPLVNGLEAITTARNKFLTQQMLTASGLPCPDTIFINESDGFFHAVHRLGGYPVVVKSASGRQGEGVMRITNREDAGRRIFPSLHPRNGLIIQRYLPPDGRRDIRAFVIDGQCVAAAALAPANGDFRANFHLGADIRAVNLSPELEKLAVHAAAALGCDVAGVDMMIDMQNRPVIVEVNYSPGFKGMEEATGLDIAGQIVRLAVDRYHKRRNKASGNASGATRPAIANC